MPDDVTPDPAVVTEIAEPDHGRRHPTFVLIHGLGVSSIYFEPLLEALDDHAGVVMLDLPGFGESKRPDKALTMEDMAASVIKSIDNLDLDDVVLVGHSMGTQVVVEILLQRPELARAAALITPVVAPTQRSFRRVMRCFLQAAATESLATAYRSIWSYMHTSIAWVMPHFRAMLRYPIEERIEQVDPDIDLLIMGASKDKLCPNVFLTTLFQRARNARGAKSTHMCEIPDAAHLVFASHLDEVLPKLLRLAEIEP